MFVLQARRAVQRGATAVIFDVSENPEAIDQVGAVVVVIVLVAAAVAVLIVAAVVIVAVVVVILHLFLPYLYFSQ